MAEKKVNASFLQRRDSSANWEKKNPVLRDGEQITVITNSGAIRHKTGDGTKTYSQLPFDDEALYNALAGKSDTSVAVETMLVASNWSNDNQQTIYIEGLKEGQNGVASLPPTFSDEEYEAAMTAEIYISMQNSGTLTFLCKGEVPSIDIPVLIILFG